MAPRTAVWQFTLCTPDTQASRGVNGDGTRLVDDFRQDPEKVAARELARAKYEEAQYQKLVHYALLEFSFEQRLRQVSAFEKPFRNRDLADNALKSYSNQARPEMLEAAVS